MARFLFYLLPFTILLAAPLAQAQQSVSSENEECPAEEMLDPSGVMADNSGTAVTADTLSEAEQTVQETIAKDGVHVVHFWAPWCSNSKNELKNGWYQVIDDHDDVSFTFVTVRNSGESGHETLAEYAVADRVTELTLPGARSDDQFTFLNLPVTWIPTTWIFHENGTLAFAMNYGEMDMDTLDHLIDLTQRDW